MNKLFITLMTALMVVGNVVQAEVVDMDATGAAIYQPMTNAQFSEGLHASKREVAPVITPWYSQALTVAQASASTVKSSALQAWNIASTKASDFGSVVKVNPYRSAGIAAGTVGGLSALYIAYKVARRDTGVTKKQAAAQAFKNVGKVAISPVTISLNLALQVAKLALRPVMFAGSKVASLFTSNAKAVNAKHIEFKQAKGHPAKIAVLNKINPEFGTKYQELVKANKHEELNKLQTLDVFKAFCQPKQVR